MAFCNSCGAQLADGTKFCSKCGAAITGAPAAAPQAIAPGPPPSSGSSSALKVVLIIVGVIVLIGVLGVATIGIIGYRIAKSAKVSQKGDNVKIETPFGNMETSSDPQKTAEELGVEIYPGAQVQKTGTASVTFGSIHTVTANFESKDSVDKVCEFYRSKFPNATVQSADQTHCSIILSGQGNSTTITAESSSDGSKFTIVAMNKKSSN
jgi:zinc-ribbon domain